MGVLHLLSLVLALATVSEAFVAPRAGTALPTSRAAAHVAYRGLPAPRHRCGVSTPKMSTAAAAPAAASAPSVKAPPQMYQNAVDIGQKKAASPASKIFLMGIISGCHIGFGALLAVTVGGNCPGLIASNPGLQKIIFGAFGGLLA